MHDEKPDLDVFRAAREMFDAQAVPPDLASDSGFVERIMAQLADIETDRLEQRAILAIERGEVEFSWTDFWGRELVYKMRTADSP
jgi:hypothetical protein